jgi:uncharacterized RDD family membrane protein YckC
MAIACLNHPDAITGLSDCARCGNTFCGDCVITLNGKPTCATCKAQNVLDIRSGTATDNVLATRGNRWRAAVVDGVINFVVIKVFTLAAVAAFVSGSGVTPQGIVWSTLAINLAAWLVWPIIYEGAMLSSFQATLGKRYRGIIVVRPDGSRLSTGACWQRAITKSLLNIVPGLGLVDALFIFQKDHRCLHDRMAKTIDVIKPQ